MPLFRKSDLKTYNPEITKRIKEVLAGVAKSKTDDKFDIFLSHSYDDADLIGKLYANLVKMGFSVYVDWITDKTENRVVINADVARWIRHRMDQCETLLYATSDTSSNSKWMPWELGYFDGSNGKVAVLPITESAHDTDDFKGQEFLGIYPYITHAAIEGTQDDTLWVHRRPNEYVNFNSWRQGFEPRVR